ncbi:MAG: hypothetical protein WA324_06575 [Bryobacteraceae bacterium]
MAITLRRTGRVGRDAMQDYDALLSKDRRHCLLELTSGTEHSDHLLGGLADCQDLMVGCT